ncbi:MAG TPA: hypothetical protein P5556_01855 [Candidatus Gastranaerophilales bacterium]|nr:hypothetical protein [Candidatus Gastranaerophilales bacterium]
MKLNAQKAQALVQYLLIAVVVLGLIYMLIPVFQEANKSLTQHSAPQANQKLNQEGIILSPILAGSISPGAISAHPSLPPSLLEPPPPTSVVGNCGPNGCGTTNLATEEGVCGTIPGAAGVLDDGCWKCDTGSGFWFWETNAGTCSSYWYGDLSGTCSSQCMPHSPPFNGIQGGRCYVCTNSGSFPGYWQKRKDTGIECSDFWNAPFECKSSDIAYETTCGCIGVPPVYGIYHEKTTKTDMCWLCDGTQWINSTDITKCEDMWIDVNGSCPAYVPENNDYPYCGCKNVPPARGPNPYGNGTCWLCHSGTWLKENDSSKCNDYWAGNHCPASSMHTPLACNNALPATPPTAGHCWLCTNPTEDFKEVAYDATNPLYILGGEPCNLFWVSEVYPGYINIPNSPDNVNTVCSNALTSVSFPSPGIVYDLTKDQWGCWACSNAASPYQWVHWQGDRFSHITDAQYQACKKFWMDGIYPVLPASPGAYERIYEYGGIGYEAGRSIAVSGNYLFIAGEESSDADGGGSDIFVMKVVKNTGEILWKKQFGGSKDEKAFAIAVLGSNIYVTGHEASASAGGGYDVPVIKLDHDGNVIWYKQFGGAQNERGYSIAISNVTGHVYITGSESSDIDGGNEDIFVMELDSAGNMVWKKQYGGADRDVGHSIAFSDNSLYVTGYEMSDSYGGISDIVVMKLDISGNVMWKKQYGGGNTDRGQSITVSEGYLYVTGYEMSDFDGGKSDIVVMKLDTNGNVVWKNQYGGLEDDKGYSIKVAEGFIYVTGEEESDPEAGANFDGLGEKDLFVMKLSKTNGAVIWKQQHGGSADEAGHALVVSEGYIHIVGEERSDADGGATDVLLLSLQASQPTTLGDNRDIDDWTLEGTTITTEAINGWSVNGYELAGWTVSANPITDGANGWTVDAAIGGGWTAVGNNITDGAGWSLEGVTIGTEPGANAEEIDWSPISSTSTPPPAIPFVEWKHQYGGNKDDFGRSISVPGDGYIYVTGEEKSDNADATGASRDIFVMKIYELGPDGIAGNTDDGQVLWKKQYGKGDDAKHEIGYSLTVDGGNIYVTGSKQTGGKGDQVVVMKLNSAGTIQWAKEYGGNNDDVGFSITKNGASLYVFGAEKSASCGGGQDLFVMKLEEATGNITWAMQYGSAGNEPEDDIYNRSYDKSIVVPGDGFIYVAADEASDNSPPGNRDIVVMKLNEIDGSKVWIKQWGGPYEEKAYGLAVSGGNIYVVGEEESSSPGSEEDDIFVMKLDINGNTLWKKQFGGFSQEDIGYSIVVSGNDIYLSGQEYSDFDGGSIDIFVMRLDSDGPDNIIDTVDDGYVVWKNQYGGFSYEAAYSMVLSGSHLYITGKEKSDPNGGQYDVVVMKLEVDQGASNITNWPTDQAVSFGAFLGQWNFQSDEINNWAVYGENINIAAKWNTLGVDITDWTAVGSDMPDWGDATNCGGFVIDVEVIDDWTVGL